MRVLEVESCCLMNWLSFKVTCCLLTNSYFIDCRTLEATIKHYQIKRKDSGQWYVAEKHLFQSIPDLIWYHQHNAAGKSGTSGWVNRVREPGPRRKMHLWSQTLNRSTYSPKNVFKSLKYNLLLNNPPPHWYFFVFLVEGKREVDFFIFLPG